MGEIDLVDFFLLVDTELAGAHVDKKEETASVMKISEGGSELKRDGETYTIDRIWKKSYLAKSLCG